MAKGLIGTQSFADAIRRSGKNLQGYNTWSQMYASTDKAYQQASSAVEEQYAKQVNDAYLQSKEAASNLYSKNVISGYDDVLQMELDTALNEAYNSYYDNYLSSMSEVNKATEEAYSAINSELYNEAEYMQKYAQAHIDYIKDVWNKYELGDENIPTDLFKQEQWKRLMNNSGSLISDDELYTMMFDKNGNLTRAGLDIYDMIENDQALRGKYSFDTYLRTQDELNKTNLHEWATSASKYNLTSNGTNAGSFKNIVGMNTMDQTYDITERFMGLTDEQIDDKLLKYTDYFKQGIDAIYGKGVDELYMQGLKAAENTTEGAFVIYDRLKEQFGNDIPDELVTKYNELKTFDELYKYYRDPEKRKNESKVNSSGIVKERKIKPYMDREWFKKKYVERLQNFYDEMYKYLHSK